MNDNGRVQLRNKALEDMQLEELYSERACHQWHRTKMKNAKKQLTAKKLWLEKNRPIYSKEEINRQYENGEMDYNHYKVAFASRKKAIDYRMRVDDYFEYASKVMIDQEAIVAYIDELIAKKSSFIQQAKQKPNRKYDPKKRAGRNNKPKVGLDPQQKWATRIENREFPKLQKARAFWKKQRDADSAVITVSKRMQPILQWDVDKLKQIAKDRGYYTDVALSAIISERLGVSIIATNKLLNSGRLTWGQCIAIADLFEMTPKEFCDVFLDGVFKEVSDGVYKAHVDDVEALLQRPLAMARKEEVEADGED